MAAGRPPVVQKEEMQVEAGDATEKQDARFMCMAVRVWSWEWRKERFTKLSWSPIYEISHQSA